MIFFRHKTKIDKVWFRYSLKIGISTKVHKGRLMMSSLNMLDYPMSFLSPSTWTGNTWKHLPNTQGYLGLLSEPCTPTKTL